MKKLLYTIALAFALIIPVTAKGQVSVGIGAPIQPVCNYGYYDYYPYSCAPYGYYGPTWFINGIFVGTGPWYGGRYNSHFRGGFGYHGFRGGYNPNLSHPYNGGNFHRDNHSSHHGHR